MMAELYCTRKPSPYQIHQRTFSNARTHQRLSLGHQRYVLLIRQASAAIGWSRHQPVRASVANQSSQTAAMIGVGINTSVNGSTL